MRTPPCKKNGVDCAKRHPGCQSHCPDMVPFYEACKKDREARERENIYVSYVVPVIIRNRSK